MRKWLGLIALAALAACAAPSSAVHTAGDSAKLAADKFVQLAAATPNAPPRASDPAAGPLLDTVFNTQALQGPTPSFDDLDALNAWLEANLRVGQVYMFAGVNPAEAHSVAADVNALSAETPRALQVGRNMVAYAPEVGRFMDAELAIAGTEVAVTQAYITAHPDAPTRSPEMAQGIDRMRSGFTETALGVIQSVSTSDVPNDWREARAQALIGFATRAAPSLTDAQKQQLASAANDTAAGANEPQLAQLLKQFAATIAGR
jgi:hypothetical protein